MLTNTKSVAQEKTPTCWPGHFYDRNTYQVVAKSKLGVAAGRKFTATD